MSPFLRSNYIFASLEKKQASEVPIRVRRHRGHLPFFQRLHERLIQVRLFTIREHHRQRDVHHHDRDDGSGLLGGIDALLLIHHAVTTVSLLQFLSSVHTVLLPNDFVPHLRLYDPAEHLPHN